MISLLRKPSVFYKTKIFSVNTHPLTRQPLTSQSLKAAVHQTLTDKVLFHIYMHSYSHILPLLPHLTRTKNKWDTNLHFQLEELNWAQIWQATKSATPKIVALETNYKVLTRWYLVPARISKFCPQYSAHCFRGCTAPGETYVHIWWECPIVSSFWLEVFQILSTMFSITLPSDPAVALLNSKPHHITHCQFKLPLFITTTAKQTIAKAWKSALLSILSVKRRVTQAMI